MDLSVVNRYLPMRRLALGILALAVLLVIGRNTLGGIRSTPIDPAQVVPLHQIAPEFRESVSEVIRDNTLHRKGAPETFPCEPKIYLSLLNEPMVTLALWQDLSSSPVQLRQLGPNSYEGSDGAGASASWKFVHRSPKLHVMLCHLNYVSPKGPAKVDARVVLVIHSGFYKEVNGEHWVQHDIEAFVKVDSLGWKTVARTVRPVGEKILEDQVKEAGWFVSLMGRLVAMYPDWASGVVANQKTINADARDRFVEVVTETKRPGAFTGRPTLAENSPAVLSEKKRR